MNYYNEFDPFAAARLRELIKDGLIADGDVDERPIQEIKPDEIRHYTQCHFFAGIGGWSYALRLAGWGDTRRVWTGSPPCQPFSAAGKQAGKKDERHLWPEFFRLISECRPPVIFGEQVSSAISHNWFDDLQTDLERENYATGMVVLPAASVGAPHKRDRLWFVADAESKRGRKGQQDNQRGFSGSDAKQGAERERSVANGSTVGKSNSNRCSERCETTTTTRHRSTDDSTSWVDSTLGNAKHDGSHGSEVTGSAATAGDNSEEGANISGESTGTGRPDQSGDICHWSDSQFIYCRDGKYRPIPTEPNIQLVVDGLSGFLGSGSNAYSETVEEKVINHAKTSEIDTREVLQALWYENGTQEIQRQTGRFNTIYEQGLLHVALCKLARSLGYIQKSKDERITEASQRLLRDLWSDTGELKATPCSSYQWGLDGQQVKEFSNLVHELSHEASQFIEKNGLTAIGAFPLSDNIPNRVGILRGAGNAIVPQVAAEVIKAFMEYEK